MAENNRYDVIIIGTGAGGGTLAYRLAASGKRILLLERGGYLPREKDNWDSKAVFVESKYRAKETWYDKDCKPFYPGIQYYVGGNTKVYGAALLRFRERDFGEVAHHGGISPAWPLSYRGLRAVLHQGRASLSCPWAAWHRSYRRPSQRALSLSAREPRTTNSGVVRRSPALGHHPFPLPLGILLDEADGKACTPVPVYDAPRLTAFRAWSTEKRTLK